MGESRGFMIKKVYLYAAVLLVYFCTFPIQALSQSRIVEYLPRSLPLTSLVSLEGKNYQLDKLEGNILLIHFWATWCPSCVEEIKALNQFQKLLRKDKIIVLPISEDFKGAEVVKKFYNTFNLGYLPAFIDKNNQWFRAMKVNSLPATFVVDMQGRNVAMLAGGVDWLNQKSIDKIKTFISSKQEYNPDYLKLISEHIVVENKQDAQASDSNKKIHIDEIETKVAATSADAKANEISMTNAPDDFQTRRSINNSVPKPEKQIAKETGEPYQPQVIR